MSRPIIALAAAAVAACTLVGAADAQRTDSLRQRVAELRMQWEAANRDAVRAESLAAARTERIAIREGAFDVALVGTLPVAREGVARAWREVRATLGGRAERLAPVPMTVTVINGRHVTIRAGEGESTIGFGLGSSPTAGLIARHLVTALYSAIDVEAPAALRNWAGGNLTIELRRGDLRRAYEALVTTPHHAAGPCAVGDLDACRVLLGLVPAEDPLTAWYDAADLYAAALRLTRPNERFRPEAAEWYDRCTVERDDAGCLAFLRQAWRNPQPAAPRMARNTLVRLALRVGGTDAADRLADSEGTIPERLAHTAGVPVDELLTEWLNAMYAATGAAPSSFGVWTGALMWIVVLSGLSLRSSRWK